jgi:hypothetical protein
MDILYGKRTNTAKDVKIPERKNEKRTQSGNHKKIDAKLNAYI